MPLVDVVVLAVVFIGVGTFCVAHWHPGPKRTREVQGLHPAAVARLGEPLARWCVTTRQLIAAIELLREQCDRMGALEQASRALPRGVMRQVRDANFYSDTCRARKAGHAWIEEARSLPDAARLLLAEHEVDPESLATAFAFPWGLTADHDRLYDRSDEITTILRDIHRLVEQLGEIACTLAAIGSSPYR